MDKAVENIIKNATITMDPSISVTGSNWKKTYFINVEINGYKICYEFESIRLIPSKASLIINAAHHYATTEHYKSGKGRRTSYW